ncbi:MAG TPA: class I SAM-dependent methyltransferase [Symbiobacteriaceae bacterium]
MTTERTHVLPATERLFTRIAHAFEGDAEVLIRRRRRWLAQFQPGERVLDLGCGDGYFMELLRNAGGDAIGVEIDPERAAAATQKGLSVFCGSFEQYFEDRSPQEGLVDGVMLGHVIEHLRPQEAVALLRRCVDVLKPGGRVIILTPNIGNPVVQETFWLDVTHERPYPRLLLEMMLRTLGCRVVSQLLEGDMEVAAVGVKEL